LPNAVFRRPKEVKEGKKERRKEAKEVPLKANGLRRHAAGAVEEGSKDKERRREGGRAVGGQGRKSLFEKVLPLPFRTINRTHQKIKTNE